MEDTFLSTNFCYSDDVVKHDALIAVGLFALLIFGWAIYLSTRLNTATLPQSKAQQAQVLSVDNLSTYSLMAESDASSSFFLSTRSPSQSLYDARISRESDALAFVQSGPLYSPSGFGQSTGGVQSLIPDSANQLSLIGSDSGQHYYFQQTGCNGIPVLSSILAMHTNNSNKIYAISGNLQKDSVSTCTPLINSNQAIDNARRSASQEFGESQLTDEEQGLYIVDMHLLGFEDSGKYLAYGVRVCDSYLRCSVYFIDSQTGKDVYSYKLYQSEINRRVSKNNIVRNEGDSEESDNDVNKLYDLLGETYEFFSSDFGRDGIDGSGGPIRASITSCREAGGAAVWTGSNIRVCPSFLVNDVVAHEFAHGVTQYSIGGTLSGNEQGALNEALSDVYSYGVDEDWTMGEDSRAGVIRNLENPPAVRDRIGPQADRMFSANYYCGSADNGGVHHNSGVLSKAFSLMVQGGDFNGCSVSGIGREKAHEIIYKAETVYLRGNSRANFGDMYRAVMSACSDIYSSEDSAECQAVKSAMQATEMDQQDSRSTKSPVCRSVSARTPECAGEGQTTPTPGGSSPSPTSGQETPSPSPEMSPTPTPAGYSYELELDPLDGFEKLFFSGKVNIEYDGQLYTLSSEIKLKEYSDLIPFNQRNYESGVWGRLIGPDVIDTGEFSLIDKDNYVFSNNFSIAKDLSEYPTYVVYAEFSGEGGDYPIFASFAENEDNSPESVVLDLSLRFQGISRKPQGAANMLVKVGLASESQETKFTTVLVKSDENGVWRGKAVFDKSILADNPAVDKYKLFIKGPRHSQKRICTSSPQESEPGSYTCSGFNVKLEKGINKLDLTGITLLAGDTWPQDGVINSVDMALIRNNLNSAHPEVLTRADLNMDGIINAVDDSLIISALSIRVDEE
ncbi:MAG: M4 family metallopeptidase [Candidatus Paceibacterota bacterium]